jgi:hypothetical protein
LPTTLLTRMTSISLRMQWPLTSQLHGSVSQREQLVFCYGSNSTPLSDKESPRPALTLVHGMENCVGLNKAINHWRKFAWPRFEPGSPKWHTGALSTTPQAHAHILRLFAGARLKCARPWSRWRWPGCSIISQKFITRCWCGRPPFQLPSDPVSGNVFGKWLKCMIARFCIDTIYQTVRNLPNCN